MKKSAFLLIALLILAMFFSGIATASPTKPSAGVSSFSSTSIVERKPTNTKAPSYVPNEVIVKYKNTSGGGRKFATSIAATSQEVAPSTQLLKLKQGISVENAVAAMKKNPDVAYAEPNGIIRTDYWSTDPDYSKQWGYANYGLPVNGHASIAGDDIQLSSGWNLTNGGDNPAKVAVIDSGIDMNHPEFTDPVNKIENDGYGGRNYAGISNIPASQYEYSAILGHDSTNQWYSQSIKGTGDYLSDVTFGMGKHEVDDSAVLQPITVSVRSSLTGPDLAHATIQPSDVYTDPKGSAGYAWGADFVQKTLSTSVRLDAGTTYYLVLHTTNTGVGTATDKSNWDNYYYLAENVDYRYQETWYDYQGNPITVQHDFHYQEGSAWDKAGGSWEESTNDAGHTLDFYFRTNPNSVPHDDCGHGTHVAGIIVGQENGQGGVGVAFGPHVTILPVKVTDCNGTCDDATLASGIRYAVDEKVNIINLSLGGEGWSDTLNDACNYANSKGVLIFAAAGNSGDTTSITPANCDHVISVGATDNNDKLCSFSSYGPYQDLVAPGYYIWSSLTTYPSALDPTGASYGYMSGTSMASPMAAGEAALLISNLTTTPAKVEALMLTYTKDLGTKGRDDRYGYGRLDVYGALLHESGKAPKITSITPNAGVSGTKVTVKGSNFGLHLETSHLLIDGMESDVSSWSDTAITAEVYGTSGKNTVTVKTAFGSASTSFEMYGSSYGALTWYFAEGATWPGMDEWLLLQNPNAYPSQAKIKYITPNGVEKIQPVTVPANSRVSIYVDDQIPNRDVSIEVDVTNQVNIVAERAMYFNGNDNKWGSHDSIGVDSTSPTWYLAEGCTRPGYDEWVLIFNPNNKSANINVSFQTQNGSSTPIKKTLKPYQRYSVHVNDYLKNADVSTMVTCTTDGLGVVAERSMYVTAPGKCDCHNSTGVAFTSNDWTLAEGATWPGMEEWVLIQNPTEAAIKVDVTFSTTAGTFGADTRSLTVPAHRRYSLRVNDYIKNKDVSVGVYAVSDGVHNNDQFIVERAMYLNTADGKKGCHDAAGFQKNSGTTRLSFNTWYLPEGCTLNGFDEWVLIANPTYNAADVTVAFLTPGGKRIKGPTLKVPAMSRKTVHVNDYVTDSVSTVVTSNIANPSEGNIVVERAMYMNGQAGMWGATDSQGYGVNK